MLSAVLDRLRNLVRSSASGSADGESPEQPRANEGPDLFECEGCGAVFISKPEQCSTCEDDDFSNVGKFE
jgi:rubrerythrin